MPRPWTLLDTVPTNDGALELRQRGARDFMISIGGRVLMTSMITRSELTLAERGCALAAKLAAPRILIGGLGLGFTLRAALDALPARARVVVAELNPSVVEWCRGAAKAAANEAALDPRVEFFVGDVRDAIEQVAKDTKLPRYDAILWDLYVGPHDNTQLARDPLYGKASLRRTFAALAPGGLFGVWGEAPSSAFESLLGEAGFARELVRTKGGGLHHVVFLGHRPAR